MVETSRITFGLPCTQIQGKETHSSVALKATAVLLGGSMLFAGYMLRRRLNPNRFNMIASWTVQAVGVSVMVAGVSTRHVTSQTNFEEDNTHNSQTTQNNNDTETMPEEPLLQESDHEDAMSQEMLAQQQELIRVREAVTAQLPEWIVEDLQRHDVVYKELPERCYSYRELRTLFDPPIMAYRNGLGAGICIRVTVTHINLNPDYDRTSDQRDDVRLQGSSNEPFTMDVIARVRDYRDGPRLNIESMDCAHYIDHRNGAYDKAKILKQLVSVALSDFTPPLEELAEREAGVDVDEDRAYYAAPWILLKLIRNESVLLRELKTEISESLAEPAVGQWKLSLAEV